MRIVDSVVISAQLRMRSKAIIVGSRGQDGLLLAELLENGGYGLALVDRERVDITNGAAVDQLVANVRPDEVYFLAAHHHSSEGGRGSDDVLFRKSLDVHVLSAVNFLEAIALRVPSARFFYASSSHIFPGSAGQRQNEGTTPSPRNIYGITKYSGMLACRHYRETRNVFASCGILYNHESHLRSPSFISRKIAIAAAQISRGRTESLVLGNLDSKVDWGYAPDYVDAMRQILQLDAASDYVIASGQAHTVRQMVDIAFSHVGLDYQHHIIVAPNVLNGRDVTRIGDPSRLMADTGWHPTTTFESMVMKLVDYEVARLST